MDEVVRVRDEESARAGTLPKWAQTYIENLRMERDAAIRALNRMVDQDTPSPIYFEEWPCTGEERGPVTKRRYIQTNSLHVEHEGVKLDIICRRGEIDLQYHRIDYLLGPVLFTPSSFQSFKLSRAER